ncbi:hypothetical protein SSX86_009053 [Deinandra increscens subsp. villosa]|uniref:Secreted protein n=1 Tax=Deinandra increscens subsp. villosa TaxID=3103831 RepID=A0AAP0DGK4_9ASTR
MPSTTLICFLIIVSSQLVESASQGHTHDNVIKAVRRLEVRDQDFVTQKGPVYHEKEVSGCMPKGRRHSSAPSRYVNSQAFFDSLGCSKGARP